MSLRQALAGQPCPRFGDGEADEGDAVTPSVTKRDGVAPKRDGRRDGRDAPQVERDERNTVTHDEFAALKAQVEKLTLQVARMLSAQAVPSVQPTLSDEGQKAMAAARAAAYRKRQREAKGG